MNIEIPIKVVAIPSCKTGDYHIALEIHEYYMDFECFEQTASNEDGTPAYDREDWVSLPDFVDSLDDAQAFMSGSIKWDGCVNMRFCEQTDDRLLHFCGQDETDKVSQLFARLYALAAEHLPHWDGPTQKAMTTANIRQCSRCGHDHPDLEMKPLANAPDEWKFFAMCPRLGQPIMIAVVEEESPK